ncbi:MAG TPA: hypothetical protein VGO93_16725 [Candidatus Xenobia bacterium]|jgi:hypothetical protein
MSGDLESGSWAYPIPGSIGSGLSVEQVCILNSPLHKSRHEAAHAIALLHHGWDADHVALYHVAGCEECMIDSHCTWKRHDPLTKEERAVVFLAGPEMDRAAKLSRKEALSRDTNTGSDYRQALDNVPESQIDNLCNEAEKIIRAHITAILAVSERLQLVDRMTDEDIRESAFEADTDLQDLYQQRRRESAG